MLCYIGPIKPNHKINYNLIFTRDRLKFIRRVTQLVEVNIWTNEWHMLLVPILRKWYLNLLGPGHYEAINSFIIK